MEEAERMARMAVVLPVVRQQPQLDIARVGGLQVAELAVDRRSALRAADDGDGGVAIGRDVPVVGNRRLEAAAAVEAEARRQEAGAALVVERKAQHRRGEDRHAVEAQHRVAGDAGAGLVVGLDAPGLQDPRRVGVVGTAARVGGVDRDRPLLVEELDQRRLAAGVGAFEAIGRAAKEALEALDPKLQLGPEEDVALAADDDVAGGAREILGLVVGQPVGADHDRAAAELDVADGLGVEVGPAAHLARLQDDRQLLAGVAARRRRARWSCSARCRARSTRWRAQRRRGRCLCGRTIRQDRQHCDGEDA